MESNWTKLNELGILNVHKFRRASRFLAPFNNFALTDDIAPGVAMVLILDQGPVSPYGQLWNLYFHPPSQRFPFGQAVEPP